MYLYTLSYFRNVKQVLEELLTIYTTNISHVEKKDAEKKVLYSSQSPVIE